MIDIKDLEAFVAILNGGSLSRAAAELGLTQPALSLKLKKMETELGVKLFQRTPRSMCPLDTALTIEPRVRDILSKFDGVRESLAKNVSELRGNVRVGCLLGWFDALLVPSLKDIFEKTPDIRMQLHVDQTDHLMPLVAHGKLDLAIVAEPFDNHEGLAVKKLLDEELVLVGRNLPKTKTEVERRKSLLTRPWITMSVPDPLVDKFWREQFGGAFPYDKVTIPVCLDNILTLPDVVGSIPNGVGVLPRQIVRKRARQEEGKAGLEMSDLATHRNGLFLVWRKDGMELKRYQMVKDTILEHATRYLND